MMTKKNTVLERIFQLKEEDYIKRFGKFFTTEKNFYFYDTGTSKVLMIDENIYNAFIKIMNEPLLTYESFVESLSKEEMDSVEEFCEAIEECHIFGAKKLERLHTELHCERLEEQLDKNLHQITLELTGACNLRCGYCIYNENYDGNRNFHTRNMSKEVAFKAIDYLEEHGSGDVAVTFYGGEPLLQFDLIKECVEYSKKVVKKQKLNFSLTTNLTLMTEEKAKYFAGVDNFAIVCSLDGPEEVQNSYRKFANGKGTFADAIKGLEILVKAYGEKAKERLSVNTVFAPPYTYEKLESIRQFFSGLEWLPDDFNVDITYVGEGTVDDSSNIEELMKDPEYLTEQGTFNPLFLWSKKRFAAGCTDYISMNGIEEMLLRVHKRNIYEKPEGVYPFNACCVPGARRLYISTEGDLYVCEKIGASPKIGTVFKGIDINAVRKNYIDDYADDSSKHCSGCWAIRLCQRCYIESYNKEGYQNEGLAVKCKELRDYIERELTYYHQLMEDCPERLDYLNQITIS